MAQNAEIFFEHDSWPRALGWSAGFHIAVTAFILLYPLFSRDRPAKVGARAAAARPWASLWSVRFPYPPLPPTQNVLANESKGVTKSEPKVEEKEPDAIEIQGKNTKIKPKKPPAPTKAKPNPRPKKKPTRLPSAKVAPSADLMALSRPEAPRAASASPAAAATSAPAMAGTCRSSSGKFPRTG
jgi:outer membrane biosynthesis protein TonB